MKLCIIYKTKRSQVLLFSFQVEGDGMACAEERTSERTLLGAKHERVNRYVSQQHNRQTLYSRIAITNHIGEVVPLGSRLDGDA